jgi:hypothetical protein
MQSKLGEQAAKSAAKLSRPKTKGAAVVRKARDAAAADRPAANVPPLMIARDQVKDGKVLKPKVLTVVEKPKAVDFPAAQAVIEQAAKPEPKPPQQRARGLNNRYEGSKAQQWDNALQAGGKIEDMAKALNITTSVLRRHLQFRLKLDKNGKAKWRVEQNGDTVKMFAISI